MPDCRRDLAARPTWFSSMRRIALLTRLVRSSAETAGAEEEERGAVDWELICERIMRALRCLPPRTS